MAVTFSPSGLPVIRTIEDLKRLTPAEVNEHWNDVRIVLEGGGRNLDVSDNEAPLSIADLKGKSADYVNKHWKTVVQLLEADAQAAKEERAAKEQR